MTRHLDSQEPHEIFTDSPSMADWEEYADWADEMDRDLDEIDSSGGYEFDPSDMTFEPDDSWEYEMDYHSGGFEDFDE